MPTLDPERRRANERRRYARIMATPEGREKLAGKARRISPSWLRCALDILCADADSVILKGEAVIVQAEWTRWAPMRFSAGSREDNLREAIVCRAHYRRTHPND